MISRPPKPRCFSCNSSCESCGGSRSRVGLRSSFRMAFSLEKASAPGSRRICSRISTSIRLCRLPNGVFSPYTSIPTNLLFFDRGGPTKDVWYYEQPLPGTKKNYTKTLPIQFEEFTDCLKWWKKRRENERAWKVPAGDLLARGCNLDVKNPNAAEDLERQPPERLAIDILAKEQRIIEVMREIQQLLIEAAK